jgi:predicted ArsR family transcriptional regulator
MTDAFAAEVAGVGALVEPARRALYQYVVGQPDAVSREQAAEAVELPLHSAKFHLDRLVAEGLLEVEFRRLTGRTGPGAGRPSKLYRRSARQLSVSLPERRYDLAGEVLAAAIDMAERDGVSTTAAVGTVAREEGTRLAHAAQTAAETSSASGSRPSDPDESDLDRTADVLERCGYEPRVGDDGLLLANCPFDRLAADHTDLVCGMNLALVGGVLDGLEISSLTPRLEPEPGTCCVRVRLADAVPDTSRSTT